MVGGSDVGPVALLPEAVFASEAAALAAYADVRWKDWDYEPQQEGWGRPTRTGVRGDNPDSFRNEFFQMQVYEVKV